MMAPLNRKLLRDLWRLRGQVLAIAAVMAAGICVLVMALTTVDALRETALAYYERHAFAHVFARVERAPDCLAERIRRLPGVQTVETRVVHTAILDVTGFEEPVIGQLVSVPERRAKTAAAFVDEAKATLEMRGSEYAQAKARLLTPTHAVTRRGECECVLVHSPVSGTVLRLVTESEGIVQPGAALVEVGDPARLEVVVDLLSAEAVRVRAGQRVLVEAWGGEQPLDGVVRRVEPFGFMKVSALGIEEQAGA